MSNTDKSLVYLGSKSAKLILYLPNPPEVDSTIVCPDVSVEQVIQTNGNHWRKILTIFAKLACPGQDWKKYRDNELLQHFEALCFGDQLYADGHWHLIGGKASWQRFGFDLNDFTPLDELGLVYYRDKMILTPYPDYRQFPNALIQQVKVLMQGNDI